MFELVASGGFWELSSLGNYENQMAEDDKGLLELDLTVPVSAGIAQALEDQLRAAGVADVRVTSASPLLRIYFKKGFPWLAVIAAIILGLIVLAILIVGWRLFKDVVPEAWQPLVGGLGLVLLLGLGIVILARRQL